MNDNPQIQRRHWSSLRLSYGLLAITAISFVLGYWISPAITQMNCASQIRAKGGRICCATVSDSTQSYILKYFFPPEAYVPITRVSYTDDGTTLLPSAVRCLHGAPRLSSLSLSNQVLTEEALTAILKLKGLKVLDLSNSTVDDKLLQILANHPSLKRIRVWRSDVTRNGAEQFTANSSIILWAAGDLNVRFYHDGQPIEPPLRLGQTYAYELSAFTTEKIRTSRMSINVTRENVQKNSTYRWIEGLPPSNCTSKSSKVIDSDRPFETGTVTIDAIGLQGKISVAEACSLQIVLDFGKLNVPIVLPDETDVDSD